MGGHRDANKEKKPKHFENIHFERSFSQGFIMKTITIGEHKKDNEKLKPKICKKKFIVKDRFYVKFFWTL